MFGWLSEAGGLGLATEARLEDGIHRQVGAKSLNCNDSRQTLVESEVNFGHPAAPDERRAPRSVPLELEGRIPAMSKPPD